MLAIVPARGGSKGLPGKNLKLLCGAPLIEWTIRAALGYPDITRVVVSTDSAEIADVSKKAGADVPFLRPAELSTDEALSRDVYLYTCERIGRETGVPVASFVTLQPTSPLRTGEDIVQAIRIFKQKNADSVISVYESPHSIEWHRTIDATGVLRETSPQGERGLQHRQALERSYLPNGAIFVFKTEFLKVRRGYYSDKTFPYIMPAERSIDIDTAFDFQLAEFLMGQNAVAGGARK